MIEGGNAIIIECLKLIAFFAPNSGFFLIAQFLVVHSLIHSFTHSLIISFNHSIIHYCIY